MPLGSKLGVSEALAIAGAALFLVLLGLSAAGCGEGGTAPPPVAPTPTPEPTPEPEPEPEPDEPPDPFAFWNDVPPEPWWRESAPYTCHEEENPNSPWLAAGLEDLGGSDPLSLIRFFGNGIYLRYGNQGFRGCTFSNKNPEGLLLDPPQDPKYYSLGDLEITVDLARVPPDASGWHNDDGERLDMSLSEAVRLLNVHVAAFFRRISEEQLRMKFLVGEEFDAPGDGSPAAILMHQRNLVGACLEGRCRYGAPGGLNRILLSDVGVDRAGFAWGGRGSFGIWSFVNRFLVTMVHEIGHGWMGWPHSYPEVPWAPADGLLHPPNPYSHHHDMMSSYVIGGTPGWSTGMPSTLAINRYSAGWIPPEDVALHLQDRGTYTLARPRQRGYQFLVVHSGRRHAFTTLEVLDDFPRAFQLDSSKVYDPSAPGGRRRLNYEGVLVARYDQTAGTGINARVGPALYDTRNPDWLHDVGYGYDDYSLIQNGQSRDIGGGVRVRVSRNRDGSYDVDVSGGRTAAYDSWCVKLRFWRGLHFDTGCALEGTEWIWE